MSTAWRGQGSQPANGASMRRIVPRLVPGLCVGVGILLAALGGGFGGGTTVSQRAGASHAPVATYTPGKAALHRKQVFDERRARFDAATQVRTAAAPTATGPTVRTSP